MTKTEKQSNDNDNGIKYSNCKDNDKNNDYNKAMIHGKYNDDKDEDMIINCKIIYISIMIPKTAISDNHNHS